MYELDGDALHCVSAEKCTEMGGYALTDNGEKKCVEKCPVFFETVGGVRTCVASCARFVDGDECLDACESGAFEDVSGDTSYRKCVKLDSCSHYVNEKVTIGTKNVTHAHCLSSCPESLPVRGTGSKQC